MKFLGTFGDSGLRSVIIKAVNSFQQFCLKEK